MSTLPPDPVPLIGPPLLDFALSRETLDAIAAPIWITDQDHRCVYMNAACAALIGPDPSALVGRLVTDVLPPVMSQAVVTAGQRALTTGVDQVFAVETTDGAGHCHHLTATTRRFVAPNGEPLLMVSLQDITPLHRVEQALQRQSERDRLLGAIAPGSRSEIGC